MKILLAILMLQLTFLAFGRVGMGETSFYTPNGHQICDCDPYNKTPVLVGHEDQINLLDKWYFYRGYVIGMGKDYYFIFNERRNLIQYFKSESEWNVAVQEQSLNPFFTRWLDISDSIDNIAIYLFFYWPILLLVLIVAVWTIIDYKVWKNKKSLMICIYIFGALFLLVAYRLNLRSL